MADGLLRYTRITNVSHVDAPDGARLWAQFVLIDDDAGEGFFKDSIRQIRGLTYGGQPAFTYWIDPKAEVELRPIAGGRAVLLSHTGELKNMDRGLSIAARASDGGELVLRVNAGDLDLPVQVARIEVASCPFGADVDREVLRTYRAPYYPFVIHVPKEEVLTMREKGWS